MNALYVIGAFVVGLLIGAIALWLASKSKISGAEVTAAAHFEAAIATRDAQIQARDEAIRVLQKMNETSENEKRGMRQEISASAVEASRLKTIIDEERRAAQEKLNLVNEARDQLSDAFKALSAEALKNNNESFLDLAKSTLERFHDSAKTDLAERQKAICNMVAPVEESLKKVDGKLHELERERITAYVGLNQQVKNLALTQLELKGETAKLVRALRTPNVRGRWGEIQLSRVVEIAGMLPYCDFDEQQSKVTDDGRLRPDMLVRLPGGKNIVVDAKAPLDAYLNALETDDDEAKSAFLQRHAKQLRDHMVSLGSKGYWDQFQPTPEFVIMFLPGETFFSAALEKDPHLIEEGVNQKVILASPTTLIALLKAISYGWNQEKLAEGAQEISELGKELFDRLCVFADHLQKLGSNLDNAITSYNKAIGSFDSRVLVSARKFTDLGLSSNKEVPYLKQSDKSPRQISSPEITE